MNFSDFFHQFQGIATLFSSDISISITRIFLIFLGLLLMYLGKKGVLEALLMIPMGLGMATINASLMFLPHGVPGGFVENGAVQGTLFLDSMVTDVNQMFDLLQIDFLQPVYVFTFSNGLIACLVFMGIGSLLDIGFLLQRPFTSMLLALCAELGTFVVVPIAQAMGLTAQEAASIAMVGGADGPMVLFTSLSLAKHLFVPITVVAYLYLGLTYGGYPYLIRLLIPKKLRAIKIDKSKEKPKKPISASTKLAAAGILCVVLCLLFPVASPLFFSLFLGISIKEAKLTHIHDFISGPLLYGSTFFLGLTLGVLCEAHLLLDPRILKLLVLGILALLFSGIGGIIGGYIMYFIKGGNFNPTIGIAGVSCVPSTAKVAQKEVTKSNPNSMILPEALGANICGVITSAIIAGLYINFFR
ncbi:sodium ion-translocating decarboxylase, beta subunit [Paludibacter propionicigenes WB4]|uniref:Sodium ion-translocating decarboxylase, beta subunit n=1 Tax=Paludibacter propionicigenes (strain DSM 17365 / JCM 13257 / WB4) TaxID=694427 RepID=E4T3X1_PALPW|nr:sodium ion-translocating decarboxylase subunit beta [Paludibacter propionicigenes]ADQ79415.1 sodium ion-translocating decarboxylase, beta subunit [Paludibacter propionicigenes WB4]